MRQDVLLKLLNDKSIFLDIIKEFPSLYAPCVSIRQKISKEFVEFNVNKIVEFYNSNVQFKLKIDSYISPLKSTTQSENSNVVAGTVLVIDKNEESYKKIIDTAYKEKWIYKGISIVEEFSNLRLYFY